MNISSKESTRKQNQYHKDENFMFSSHIKQSGFRNTVIRRKIGVTLIIKKLL
jgi:hypothetical protein